MRKLLIVSMLTILFSLLSLSSNAQTTPTSFSVHGGYSWLNGVVGAELQSGCFGISGGWMPTTMPISGDKVNSYGFAVSLYSGPPSETISYYLSGGIASDGYQYEDSYGYGKTEAVTIIMAGTKYNFNSFYAKLGLGYGFCSEANSFTFEATIGIPLFKNYNK
jgi:hypothetical protein